MKTVAICACALLLAACSNPRPAASEPVVIGDYAAGFEAAKEVLREYRFELERIDARHGVITSRSKPTAGALTPWDSEQTTTRQELEEVINQQFRTVRIEFAPTTTPMSGPGTALTPQNNPEDDLIDLRNAGQELHCRVIVTQMRVHRAGRQPSTKSIRSSTMYSDPALNARGLAPVYIEELGRDHALESRLQAAIERKTTQVNK